jgi:hypothetical protein
VNRRRTRAQTRTWGQSWRPCHPFNSHCIHRPMRHSSQAHCAPASRQHNRCCSSCTSGSTQPCAYGKPSWAGQAVKQGQAVTVLAGSSSMHHSICGCVAQTASNRTRIVLYAQLESGVTVPKRMSESWSIGRSKGACDSAFVLPHCVRASCIHEIETNCFLRTDTEFSVSWEVRVFLGTSSNSRRQQLRALERN